MRKPDIQRHDVAAAWFLDLFWRCEDWAWRYFRLGVRDFRIQYVPLFAHELELQWWSSTNCKRKACFNVNHLVHVVVLGNILARKVFAFPFAGCSTDFRREFHCLYEVKLEGNDCESAHAGNEWMDMVLTDHSGGRTGGKSLASE